VQEEEPRARGQGHRQLEPPLVTVGQGGRHLVTPDVEPHEVEDRPRVPGEAPLLLAHPPALEEGAPEPDAAPQMKPGEHVVEHGEAGKHARLLERADEAAPGDGVGAPAGDADALVADQAGRRPLKAGDHVERRRFTGAVRADQAGDGAGRHLEADVAERGDAAEAHRDAADLDRRRTRAPLAAGDAHRPRQRPASTGTMPRGMKYSTAIRSAPYKSICQCHGVNARSASGSTVKMTAPTTGPNSVPFPPATTMMTIVTV